MTVRDATFDFLRRRGLTDIFSNPGSTEIPFLTGLPDDLNFVLGLHEGSVVSMASGYALARRRPSFALLHTTPGFGNAVNAIATARVNRTPIVIAIGQQDRRHIAFEPFLAGRLDGLAGDYPVWVSEPSRAQDVPGALERAYHEAETHRGPAIVIVPMGDWLEEAGEPHEVAAPQRVLRPGAVDDGVGRRARRAARALRRGRRSSRAPGSTRPSAGRRSSRWPSGSVRRCTRSRSAARPGSRRTIRSGPGRCRSCARSCARRSSPYDVVVVVGAPVFRQSGVRAGPLRTRGHRARRRQRRRRRSAPQPGRARDARRARPRLPRARGSRRAAARGRRSRSSAGPEPPPAGAPLTAAHVLQALGDRLPADAVVVEECPSNRDELMLRMPARQPLGMVSPAMGGLGWALPASVGLRMGLPDRPVVAVLGDGSTVFGIQGLWSAARYGIGPLVVVLKNGGYRIMDQLAARQGGPPAWPSFGAVDIAAIAEAFGCEARRIGDAEALGAALAEVVPDLRERTSPLLLEVTVEPD